MFARTQSAALGVVAALGIALASSAEARLETVDHVDLERYQGRWFEIALLPNFFQRRCASDTSAYYELMEDGRVRVVNRCRESDGNLVGIEGVARLAKPDGPTSVLQVRFAPRWLTFLPLVWGDYRVIALGPDYDYALVGTRNRRYLWILARSPELDPDILERLRAQAAEQGFDIGKLRMTPHTDGA